MSDLQGNSTEIVTVDAARRAEPVVREPDALALKEAENAHAQSIQKVERGLIGLIMGSKTEKSGNIAFVVIFFCFVVIVIGFLKFDMKIASEFDSFMKLVAAFSSIITGALGYIFGAAQKTGSN